MKKITFVTFLACCSMLAIAQKDSTLKKKDYKMDVLIQTSMGDMVLRLSDSTPLHRNNFLKLVKVGFFDSILFHRVIKDFMIQSGDPLSKSAPAGQPLGNGGPGYTVPAEIKSSLFHKRGALAAARMGDNVNPNRESSGSQFYIVHGKKFTASDLDILETRSGKKYSPEQRAAYTTNGGAPHLDGGYTVFGELISGFDVLDKIATTTTSKGMDRDRPVENIKIIKAKLIKRKKK